MGPIWVLGLKKMLSTQGIPKKVTHVSTNPARPSLTSVIGRELVYSTRHEDNRENLVLTNI